MVEPRRLRFGENIAERLRRLAKNALVLIHAGLDEPRRLPSRQRAKVPRCRVRQGVADPGVPDVDVGEPLVDCSSSGMAFDVRGRDSVQRAFGHWFSGGLCGFCHKIPILAELRASWPWFAFV